MKVQEVKELLDQKYEEYNHTRFIETDPIQIVHRFSKKEDIEIMGFIIATIAWGNRTSIINNGKKLIEIMEGQPYEFIQNYSPKNNHFSFVHRTFNKEDLDFFFRGLQRVYAYYPSLEMAFGRHPNFIGVKGRIIEFRNFFLQEDHLHRSEKHISNPEKNSAAKRINMFLRWMVRNDQQGVDFGIWNSIPSSELMIPLDVHTGNIARKLGLLTRKQNDWKALEELMDILRSFDSADPVKYDFALFGLGAFDKF